MFYNSFHINRLKILPTLPIPPTLPTLNLTRRLLLDDLIDKTQR